ncbi:Spy0128 family protein [Adlercreutzia caecimuris]|uniref:Spy0128 family protein n=1 Tax=Adlercreutzia caecimuris TaxID=671266 RepID=UPI00272B4188|nr:FctA domain-containing protein [Adlercreutzia caecimuris]
MTRTSEWKSGRRGGLPAVLALAAILAVGFGLVGAPSAAAAEADALPGSYQLPLHAAAASAKGGTPVATGDGAPAAKRDGSASATAKSGAPAAKGDGSASATAKSGAPTAKGDGAPAAKKDGSASAAGKEPRAIKPAQPASFAITGMKYLQGRSLAAGEFTFRLGVAGVASIPPQSDLPKKLRQGSSLSAAEKYELVTEADLTYYPSATQPAPSDITVENAADGTVAFEPLVFDATSVGETATQRHQGAIFCYTIAELPPRNADGTLKDGVTRDALGRYVYRGVTYDNSVKRVYLYAYETGDDSNNPEIAVVPLGDAAFAGAPLKSAVGSGMGFVNIFNGAVLDSYRGAVSLDGDAIASGEFNFAVREVGEDGKLIDEHEVSCEASKGGHAAPIQLIADATYDEPGRFFYAVSQIESARSVASRVTLDESSYVITVEVRKGDDERLDAAVTYVRKKPADSDQWVDVDLDAKPSPVVWENTSKAADNPADDGSGGGSGAGSATKPDDSQNAGADAGASSGAADGGPGDATTTVPAEGAGRPDAAGSGDVATDAPSEADGPDGAGDADDAAGADEAVKPGDHQDNHQGNASASSKPTAKDDESSADGGAAKTDVAADAEGANASKAPGAFAQTGDDLGLPMLIAFLVVIASGVVLAVVSRRRNPRG